MTDQEHIKNIATYLSGHLSEAEKANLEKWIKASPENTRLFAEALKIWENSGVKLRLPTDETDQQWRALRSQLDNPAKEGKTISLFRSQALFLKVAASIILLAGIAYIFSRAAKNEITISAGNEVATVYLPDSTKVWLNANSTLTYPKDFGKDGRRTKLKGEGFFIVTPDKSSPFSVTTQHAVALVVGTSFNIKEDSTQVTLTVSEGIVKFSSLKSPEEESVTVTKGERAVWHSDNKVAKEKGDDNQPVTTWNGQTNPVKTAPEFEKEKTNPKSYLSTSYTWRKNAINQSVIEGMVRNTAMLTDYKNVVLKVTYVKPSGKLTTVRVPVPQTIKAGQTVPYQKRLLDILTNTRDVKVEVEMAVAVAH